MTGIQLPSSVLAFGSKLNAVESVQPSTVGIHIVPQNGIPVYFIQNGDSNDCKAP